jgi:hypothetical protein
MNISRIRNDDVDMVDMNSTLVLTCIGCHSLFEYSAGERRFYASKGWDTKPNHCPKCRAMRRALRAQDVNATTR